MATFESINQPQGAGVPQFAQTAPVTGDSSGAVASLVNLGASVFGQVSQARDSRLKEEVQIEETTSLGGLQQGLLDIRQAASTDGSIDVTRQSRLLLTKFNIDHPELRMEASKAFKAETGNSPSGMSVEEEAEAKLRNDSIKDGFGRHGASEEYNQEQQDIRQRMKRQDKVLSSQIQKMSFDVQAGNVHKSELRKTVLTSFQSMSQDYSAKTQGDMTDMISQFESGALSMEEAILQIRNTRNKITREVATLGEFSTDPQVASYTKPSLDSLQLAEDIITGKIEGEAINATINLNKARASAIFLSEPEVVNLVVASEAFNHTTGLQSKISANVMRFLTGGLDKNGMLPATPRPINPLNMDTDERGGVKTILQRMTDKDASPESKKEAANTLTGVAEHLGRNGMDYDVEDKKFAIDILNTKGAMDLLSPEQKSTVMMALDMYVVDTVDLAVREAVTNPNQVAVGHLSRVMGAGKADLKDFSDVADITVVDGRIYWTAKRAFAGDVRVQQQIRGINQRIEEDITPAISVYSKGLGKSFEEVAGTFLGTEAEEKEQEVKK